MSITKTFRNVSRKLVVAIVGLSVVCVGILSFALYEANLIRFSGDVSSEKLYEVIEDSPEVQAYLEEEKDYEAHFVTIASLIKQDQQQSLGRTLLVVTVPVLAIAGLLGYGVARYVLRPVRESYESQERFLQDAAHELRNPLAAMSLALENVKHDKPDANFVKTVRRQTNRLVRINEELLYLERRTPGHPISKQDLSGLLEDVLEDLQPTIAHKQMKIVKKIEPDVIFKIDPKDFVRLAKNVIENAIKYTPKGKKVAISLSGNRGVELVVKDQGVGISEEDLQHLGERFYRGKNVARVDGTGLGIAIVNKILNVYGGKFEISSELGKGTTVKITL